MAGFAPLAGGVVLAGVLLSALGSSSGGAAEDLALGDATKSSYASVAGTRIHCGDLWPDPPKRHADVCIDAAITREAGARALWLGNSQIHSINQIEDGDQTAPRILFDSLTARGVDLITLSQPNANLQEHYLVFEYAHARLPLDVLILPIVFDDTREDGVRSRLHAAFEREQVRAVLSETQVGADLLRRSGPSDSAAPGGAPGSTEGATPGATDADLAALDETVQESTETWLNDWLADHSDTWAARPGYRSDLFGYLYRARNSALRINPSTVRPLLPGPYRKNMAALDALLSRARAEGVRVLVYVPPLRSDTDPPYVADEYARFKREASELATQHGATFINVEDVVPGPLWGMKESTNLSGELEYDFMHFQAEGHTRLASALLRQLDAHVLTAGAPR